MNTYKKRKPNVWLAECDEQYSKGDIIEISNKYGKVNEHYIHNLVFSQNGKHYYSITRVDGYNAQERAKNKAEKYRSWASSAQAKADTYYRESNRDKDFLSLAEPIKVGHHSERRHRKVIDRAWNKLGKSVEASKKSEEHQSNADYWESKASEVNLSMPESIEYYTYLVEKLEAEHKAIKDTPKSEREHSYSLTYATKNLKESKEKLAIAERLRSNS